MFNVVITGGSGFIAAHLIKYLQEHSSHIIGEIHTIDRKPFHRILEFPDNIPLIHHRFELSEMGRLEKVLRGTRVVFHLARKRFEFKFIIDQNSVNSLYVRDNLNATKCLMEAIVNATVPFLVYVGDAYANLPPKDNFGVSEAMHGGEPSSYLLGEYGHTRTQAELHARTFNGCALPDEGVLQCIFLRPTFVYGEGDYHLVDALCALAFHGGVDDVQCVPVYEGSSNGMHQYIYAGTLAKVAAASMRCLIEDAQRCAGEFFYCMDEAHCTKFAKFFKPIIQAIGYRTTETQKHQSNNSKHCNQNEEASAENNGDFAAANESSYSYAYLKTVAHEILARQMYRFGWWEAPPATKAAVSSYTLRFFYGLAFGFSDRKQRLLLARGAGYDCSLEEICVAETKAQVGRHMTKTAKWAAAYHQRTCGPVALAGKQSHDDHDLATNPPCPVEIISYLERKPPQSTKIASAGRISRMG